MFNFVNWIALVFFRVFLAFSLFYYLFYAFFRQRLATSWKPSRQNWGTSKTLCTTGFVSLNGCSCSMGCGDSGASGADEAGVEASLCEFLCGNPRIGQTRKTQHSEKRPKHTRRITCSMNILKLELVLKPR